jgi:hypothetical protein
MRCDEFPHARTAAGRASTPCGDVIDASLRSGRRFPLRENRDRIAVLPDRIGVRERRAQIV